MQQALEANPDPTGRGAAADGPARQTWKVVVLGNSVATMVVPTRQSRQDGTYPEVLEWMLRDEGYEATVRNSSRPFDQIRQGVRRFMEVERVQAPDVLVIQFGGAEYRQRVIPYAVLKHLHTWDKGVGFPASTYRKHVVPHLWRGVRAYQRFLCSRVGLHTWRTPPKRFAAELRRLVAFARQEQMLVLVTDGNPPGQRVLNFMPGLDRRWAVFQRLVAEVVADIDDDDVRLVAMSEVTDKLGIEAALPDALHYSAAAHRLVAEMLAAEIVPWLEAQGAERPLRRKGP